MHGWMDGWTDGWMDEWMSGWMRAGVRVRQGWATAVGLAVSRGDGSCHRVQRRVSPPAMSAGVTCAARGCFVVEERKCVARCSFVVAAAKTK